MATTRVVSPALSYVIAVVAIGSITLASVVAVYIIRPNMDNSGIITAIFGFAATTLMSSLSYMRSTETHNIVNSRMDEFQANLEKASIVKQEQAEQRGREAGRAESDLKSEALAKELLAKTTIVAAVNTAPAIVAAMNTDPSKKKG